MKAIIIDDELHVREAIQLLANWKNLGIDYILEASDGEEAIGLILEHRPEIIITDMMMPKKNGVALLQWLQEQGSKSKIIVISGFDDYNLMRTAIHHKSFDYILKPINENILNQTIENAINDWYQDEQERNLKHRNNMKLNETINIYYDNLFTYLLEKSTNYTHIYKKIKDEFKLRNQIEYQIVIVYLNTYAKERFHGNMDLFYFSLLNIFNEYLQKDSSGIAFRNLNKDNEIILLIWNDLDNIKYTIKKMYMSVYNTLNISCIFAIGIRSEFDSNLYLPYKNAAKVLNQENLININGMIPIFDSHDNSPSKLIHVLDYSQDIGLAIYSGNEKYLTEILNQIFMTLKINKYISIEQLEIWEKEFQILKNHWLDGINFKSDDINDDGIIFWDELGTISIEKFEQAKRRQFSLLFSIYQRDKNNKDKKIIDEIKQFIEGNYQHDIKLHHISERFYFSREYISRKFKQEYNENITDYIVSIRITKAKELLTHSNLSIREISNLVGYQDEKYFSKVFKKYERLTPNDYRKKRMKNEAVFKGANS